MRRSRERHLFWAGVGALTLYTAFAIMLVVMGHVDKGTLLLTHLGAVVVGLLSGRALKARSRRS